jgi:pyruvate formate lyase activating enzyme
MLIAGIQPFSLSDFPGKSAAIIFTQGCNFRCPYCHNKQLWPLRAQETKKVTVENVLASLAHRKGQLDGVVITGGEPTLHKDLPLFLTELKKMGYATKVDTNGSKPDSLKKLIENECVDYIAMDIKGPFQKFHLLAGCEVNVADITESIHCLKTGSIPHHFRTTYYKKFLTQQDIQNIKELATESHHVTQQCNMVATDIRPTL